MKKIAAFLGLSGLSVLILPLASTAAPSLEYVTLGVMLHWNYSDSEFKAFSYGIETAYWNYDKDESGIGFLKNTPKFDRPGYGLDFGIEADRNAVRLYSEPQVGWALAGVSCGPVLEMPKSEGPARFGIQGSGWLTMMAGVDFRYRRMDGKNHQAVGVMGKWGALISGADGESGRLPIGSAFEGPGAGS